MRKHGLFSLLGILAITIGTLVATVSAGWRPLLGIDLTGGVEVRLRPVDDPDRAEPVTDEELDQAVDIIRNRVEGLDVAQPDITRQGGRIVVQLPDVDDKERAIELVGRTAELRFRPVLVGPLPPEGAVSAEELDAAVAERDAEIAEQLAELEAESGGADGEVPAEPDSADAETDGTVTVEDDGVTVDAEVVPADDDADTSEETGLAGVSEGESALAPMQDSGGDSAEPDEPEPTPDPRPAVPPITELVLTPTTAPEDIRAEEPVLVEERDRDGAVVQRWYLGPVWSDADRFLTGASLESANAALAGGVQWVVEVTARSGEDGIDLFNTAATACFGGADPRCPALPGNRNGSLAIELDGVVVSAAEVNTPIFERDNITISGRFSEQDARDLGLVLRYGALPVELEQEQARSVSSSLGRDSLEAGIIAGLVGLFIVASYMIWFYRLLGVAAMLSLFVSGTLLWVLISFFSETGFLFESVTLTLAGVVGLIVSIGVSLDSNIVYFEHLKEDVANGRTLRSSMDRSFPVAFRTIFWANLASIIGAAILYWLTASSVREFALMLGLASILDLIATYWFLRPVVRILAHEVDTEAHPGWFGILPPREAADPELEVVGG